MQRQKLRRPQNGRMIGGVCAGLADFFGLDVSVMRIIYTLLTVFTAFSGGLIYLLMWIIVPEEPKNYFHD